MALALAAAAPPPPPETCDNPETCGSSDAGPRYIHGRRPPAKLDLGLSSSELGSIRDLVLSHRRHWRKRRLGDEQTMSVLNLPEEIREQLYYFTLGAAVNYDDARPPGDTVGDGDREPSAHAAHYASLNGDVIERDFGWLFGRIRAALRDLVAPDPVAPMVPGHNFFMRIYSGEVVRGPTGAMVRELLQQVPIPPHVDGQFAHLAWSSTGSSYANVTHSLSFTLPVVLPAAGSGLRVYQVWCDKNRDPATGRLPCVDAEGRPTDELKLNTFMGAPFVHEEYVPGQLVVHSGDEFHCVSEFVDPQPDDLRLTVQGHAVFSDGAWRPFA